MKALFISFFMLSSSQIAYVGSFENSMYFKDSKVYLTSNQSHIIEALNRIDYTNIGHVVLSTGLEKNCYGYDKVKEQLKILGSKAKQLNFTVVEVKNCMGSDSFLRVECKKYSNCSYKSLSEITYRRND